MKKILMSLLVIVAVAAVAGGATYSYFSDTATSSSNTFSAGTMALKLSDSDQTALDSVNSSFEGTNLFPGAVIPQQWLIVRNNGSIDGNHLDLTVTLNSNTTDLADSILLTNAGFGNRFGAGAGQGMNMLAVLLGGSDSDYMLYKADGTALGSIDTTNPLGGAADGKISLQELADAGKIRISPVGQNLGIAAGTENTLWFNAEVSTDLATQGETVNATYTIGLDQDASQY